MQAPPRAPAPSHPVSPQGVASERNAPLCGLRKRRRPRGSASSAHSASLSLERRRLLRRTRRLSSSLLSASLSGSDEFPCSPAVSLSDPPPAQAFEASAPSPSAPASLSSSPVDLRAACAAAPSVYAPSSSARSSPAPVARTSPASSSGAGLDSEPGDDPAACCVSLSAVAVAQKPFGVSRSMGSDSLALSVSHVVPRCAWRFPRGPLRLFFAVLHVVALSSLSALGAAEALSSPSSLVHFLSPLLSHRSCGVPPASASSRTSLAFSASSPRCRAPAFMSSLSSVSAGSEFAASPSLARSSRASSPLTSPSTPDSAAAQVSSLASLSALRSFSLLPRRRQRVSRSAALSAALHFSPRSSPLGPLHVAAAPGGAELWAPAASVASASSAAPTARAQAAGASEESAEWLRNVAIIAHVDHGKTTLVDALLVHAAELQSAGDLRTSWDFEKRKGMQRMMDTGQLEKERGITITAKVCSLRFKDGKKINIIDTPGHADFSGEVERVMHLADGVLLVVDAVEGCKPQTRVVLQKALQAGLKAVVVINKVDRSSARPEDVAAQVFDLFLQLDATEEQAEFEVVYASALNRQSGSSPSALVTSMEPIVEAIMRLPSPVRRRQEMLAARSAADAAAAETPAAATEREQQAPLQLQIAHVDRNAYRGVMAMGKLLSGTLVPGMPVGVQRPGEPLRKDGSGRGEAEVKKEEGAKSAEASGVVARSPASLVGDIIVLAGVTTDVRVGESVVDLTDPRPLPPLSVAEPSVSIQVLVNTSPLAGKEVETPTSGTMLRQRLLTMTERDVSLRVDTSPEEDGGRGPSSSCLLRLSGRGPLHLALVLETLRREGFELLVAAPSVLPRWGDDGELLEPVEEMEVAVPQEHVGVIINEVKQRKGDLVDVVSSSSSSPSALSTLLFRLPTRKSFGLRSAVMSATKGTASIHAAAGGYQPVPTGEETDGLVKIARKDRHALLSSSADVPSKRDSKSGSKGCNAFIPREGAKQSGGFNVKRGIEGAGAGKKRDRGFLVATEEGTVTGKGALTAQERGQLFVAPGDQVYGGMIVGLNSRGGDLPINVCKAKKLTNMRAAHKEINEGVVPPIEVTLDYGMEIIGANEVMEVTPKSIRLAVRSAMRR
ncbi:elongation factor Tu GTP binding domain-containing protein [Besnoitia besnoiti]|uniref:Elongation factor Tu GTP binding domain-containing protein n=1 Tax=Besnoitia besnoiti TaxID=94643 RepID=A0A2A9M7J4_BESBE|nr:elongation factor Tu GTP binding domain-containing protein [Besnoitia besnoiti]PFH32271.1 elongation factor Tu GTP binding domain-containing protein [Besnoitia besnoiti]